MNNQLKGKKLLVQGAGRGNLGLVKAAKRNGVEVILTGLGGDYPCNPYADKFCYGDISNPDVICKIAAEEKVDGVAICCSDTGLVAIGRCNDTLGLVGISENAAIACSDKAIMKERLLSAGIRTPQSFLIRTNEDVETLLNKISFPLIVKAVDLQGSRGVFVVRSEEEIKKAVTESVSLSKKDYCIIEEFIEGREFGAQAFVYQGEVKFVLPHGDETIMCGSIPVPIGHYIPYEMSEELREDLQKQVVGAIQSIGLDNCAVNVDMIEKDGKIYILELSGRVGANCLPELVGNYWGVDYYEVILATSLGFCPLPYLEREIRHTCSMARMIRSEISGKILSINVPSERDAYIHFFVKSGSEVLKFSNCNDAIGEIVVKGGTLSICESKINGIISQISKTIKYE